MPFTWYEVTNSAELEQGDILRNCRPPLQPVQNPLAAAIEVDEFERVLVLTQSCDLADGGVSRVMVCPLFKASDLIAAAGGKNKQDSFKDALQKGRKLSYLLLNRCAIQGHEFDHLVADFTEAFSVPLDYAKELAGVGDRIRLLPPYREYAAQSFGFFYMRVGLPLSVDPLP